MSRALLGVLVCVAAIAQVRASAQTGAVGAYRVSGTVVNAVTGAPVPRATVAVLAEEDSHRIAAAQSDNDGRFAIGGLAAAKYQLTASKRGYSTAVYDEHGDYSSAVVTGPDLDTANLIFKLTPSAVLRGVVTGDGGDPVEAAQVMLFQKPREHEPAAKIVQVDAAITDDTGAYEFDNLGNGEYLLAVKAEPWYAMHGAGTRQGAANPALDVAYPITFYDSTTEEASASPIVLAGGNRVEADMSLHAVPALHLVVEAPRKQDGSAAVPDLKQAIFGTRLSSRNADFMDTITNGRAEFTGLAPGQYELTQGDPPHVLELDAGTSQQVEPGAGIPAFAVSGTLQTAAGAPFTGDADVTLEPAENAQGLKPVESEFNRGAFSFAAVPAGTWKLRVDQSGLAEPVISITASGRVHAGNTVTVQDRAQTLVVRVSADGARVEGFVRSGEKAVAGAMVLLVPNDPAAFPDLVRRDQSDSDGSFALRDAAPGQYTVVAIGGRTQGGVQSGFQGEVGGGSDLDCTRPEVIRRYLPGGIAVTVTDTRNRTGDRVIRLPGPVPVQMR
ncbi:MAG: carboxypeptidase-like regulatory domain-containing protein [Terracidiphilus sp.]